jgi:DNA (cytosine-5)-methyltransferase 1
MPDALTVGSLFTGVGGFDLGLERAGMRVVWQCEQNEFCQRVLAKHWPDVPCYPDVCALVADTARLREARVRAAPGAVGQRTGPGDQPGGEGRALSVPVPYVDVLCGGFPCQDISLAGKGAGLDGARSGLWFEYARIIRELRPRYVIVENVPALRSRGLDRVLGDLAACGFDAEWDCIPASAVGAPHQRDRIWLVAYPNTDSGRLALDPQRDGADVVGPLEGEQRHHVDGLCDDVAYADGAGLEVGSSQRCDPRQELATTERSGGARGVGNPDGMAGATPGARDGQPGALAQPGPLERTVGSGGGLGNPRLAEPDVCRVPDGLSARLDGDHFWTGGEWPGVPRVAHDIPDRVHRLRALGNALVPQIAEWIGRRIVAYEGARHG